MLTSLVPSERSYAGVSRAQVREAGLTRDTLWARIRHIAVRSLEMLGQAKSLEPLE